jgi:hypothetical protein
MTRSYVILRVSRQPYDEVRAALESYGYQHAFKNRFDGEIIDMHEIALQVEPGNDLLSLIDETDPRYHATVTIPEGT